MGIDLSGNGSSETIGMTREIETWQSDSRVSDNIVGGEVIDVNSDRIAISSSPEQSQAGGGDVTVALETAAGVAASPRIRHAHTSAPN